MSATVAWLSLLLPLGLSLSGCRLAAPRTETAKIEFVEVPPAGQGSPDKLYPIAGRATGARPDQRIVLYALSGVWWVQPTGDHPFTKIGDDAAWKNMTHPGSAYAALLVNPNFHPPMTVNALPKKGGDVVAVATAAGVRAAHAGPATLKFSGYDWEIREVRSNRGGTTNQYSRANAWTDERGFLHLRIGRSGNEWTSAEVRLTRNLGYGTYRFVVRDISHLEPAAVFSIFTWDEGGAREMDIEISRWGEPGGQNAQYIVQPYHVPANVIRFMAPAGLLTHSFRWQPEMVQFRTVRGGGADTGPPVDEHTFTSGVPVPGNEAVHLNLYVFGNRRSPLERECEVVIEKFVYLP